MNLYRITTKGNYYSGRAYYVVGETFEDAKKIFNGIVNTLKISDRSEYDVKAIEHMTSEVFFFYNKEVCLRENERTLILSDTLKKVEG
jgi:hypothetical protein